MTRRLALAVALALTIITISTVVALGGQGGLFGFNNSSGGNSSGAASSPSAQVGLASQAVQSPTASQGESSPVLTLGWEGEQRPKSSHDGSERASEEKHEGRGEHEENDD